MLFFSSSPQEGVRGKRLKGLRLIGLHYFAFDGDIFFYEINEKDSSAQKTFLLPFKCQTKRYQVAAPFFWHLSHLRLSELGSATARLNFLSKYWKSKIPEMLKTHLWH